MDIKQTCCWELANPHLLEVYSDGSMLILVVLHGLVWCVAMVLQKTFGNRLNGEQVQRKSNRTSFVLMKRAYGTFLSTALLVWWHLFRTSALVNRYWSGLLDRLLFCHGRSQVCNCEKVQFCTYRLLDSCGKPRVHELSHRVDAVTINCRRACLRKQCLWRPFYHSCFSFR